MNRIVLILCLSLASAFFASTHAKPADTPHHSRTFENQYLRIRLRPGWTVTPPNEADNKASGDCCTVTITHGNYTLEINPVFAHASGVDGGRIGEILGTQPSVLAIGSGGDLVDVAIECMHGTRTTVGKQITLENLYTDPARKNKDCAGPSPHHSVWFASYFGGVGPQSDYSIALTYNSTEITRLPRKNSPELRQVLSDVTRMLRTLHLKPPVVVTKILPASAPPGATVTIYGSGFNLFSRPAEVFFREYPNNPMPPPEIAADGKSLTFQVPTSIQKISCPPGQIEVNEDCVAIPLNHVDINDCPPAVRGTNFCAAPFPAAIYGLSVTAGEGIFTDPVAFTITTPQPRPVSILLLYPNYLVREGDLITVRGAGFTPAGNTVHIGSATIADIPSHDGKTITFAAPAPQGHSFIPRLQYFEASISNANGQSNSLVFSYR